MGMLLFGVAVGLQLLQNAFFVELPYFAFHTTEGRSFRGLCKRRQLTELSESGLDQWVDDVLPLRLLFGPSSLHIL